MNLIRAVIIVMLIVCFATGLAAETCLRVGPGRVQYFTRAGPADCVRGADFNAKSEETAKLLALGPGAIVHGIGHAYAEDYVTCAVLLGCEVIGLAALGT